jgi:hypothetical protein
MKYIWHPNSSLQSTSPCLSQSSTTQLVLEPAVQGDMHSSMVGSHRVNHLHQLVFEIYDGKKPVRVVGVDRGDDFVRADDVLFVGLPPESGPLGKRRPHLPSTWRRNMCLQTSIMGCWSD